jgi:hypothetical protein
MFLLKIWLKCFFILLFKVKPFINVQGVDTNANLFVKNIPKSIKEDDLDRYFR